MHLHNELGDRIRHLTRSTPRHSGCGLDRSYDLERLSRGLRLVSGSAGLVGARKRVHEIANNTRPRMPTMRSLRRLTAPILQRELTRAVRPSAVGSSGSSAIRLRCGSARVRA
jgi:hypothetical protein